MPKKKKKPTRKASKKTARPAKKMRGKAPARKKKAMKKQSRTGGGVMVEFAEIDVITGIGDDSIYETESAVAEPLDEHFPPDYGGSE
ncbi:MAG: hypothetical protein LAO19_07555 [Acidobacteriia bacterium]|nr:hypothetical protein [Terriglobia bacterium]